jgi:hypothetical protein
MTSTKFSECSSQVTNDSCAGCANRVPDGNGATVNVYLVGVSAECLG